MMKFVVRAGAQAGMEFPMDRPVVRIGRGSGSDIILQDSQASRQHAEISQQGDQLFVRDLGSTNGTLVNGERITGPRLLQPGDSIQIGDTMLASVPLGAPAGMATADDWESDLWDDKTQAQPAGGGRNWLVWALVGVVAILLIAVAIVAALTLGKKDDTPAVNMVTATATTESVVVAPTATEDQAAGPAPTSTQMVEVDVPTVEAPAVEAPTVDIQATAGAAQPAPPIKPPSGGVPVSPDQLEQMPAAVQEYLGDVPPDQLPQVISAQLQNMSPDQVQEMIGSLFPGVPMDQLPQVVAASFPGLSEMEVEGMMAMVFPGQDFQMPGTTELGAPIGGKVAMGIYDKNRNTYDLYLADQAMAQPRLLAENADNPSFSPDGQYVVYHSSAPDKGGLRIMKVDGSGDKALTSIASDRNPRFSPDGTKILFSNIDHNVLVTINRDGSGRKDVGQGKYPDWSPDGSRIVYQGCVGGGRCGLIVANADGANPAQITTDANDTMPRWRYGNVAFMSSRDGNFEIYVINPDGTWLRRITNNPATDIMPVWDPDGVRLAFRSDRDGDRAVYTTSGIGGGDFKRFSAEFGADWMLAGMDWGK